MTDRFWEIVEVIEFPLLLTKGEDGYPQARPMHLVHREEVTFWFATSRASRKVAQIVNDPRVTIVFVDTDRFNYVSIHGRAQIVTKEEPRQRFWKEAWREEWPSGPSDNDYILLKVMGERGAYYFGGTDESGEVSL